jgi:hypothetical protein
MVHENDEKQLKQERKCTYKIWHVLINENLSLSFSFSVKSYNKDVYLRDSEHFDVKTYSRGCITTPMETAKGVDTVSLDVEIFNDWLLTRVKSDPSYLIKICNHHSKPDTLALEINSSINTDIPFTFVTAYNLLIKRIYHALKFVRYLCEICLEMKNDQTFCNNLFDTLLLIHAYEKISLFFLVYHEMLLANITINILEIENEGNCHRNTIDNRHTILLMVLERNSKILPNSLTQITHNCILVRGYFYIKKDRITFLSNQNIDNTRFVLQSQLLTVRYDLRIYRSRKNEANIVNNVVVGQHTSDIKLKF